MLHQSHHAHAVLLAKHDNADLLMAAQMWASRNYPAAEPVELVLRFADKAKLTIPLTSKILGQQPTARHSDDFRSVNWYGAAYSFTANQASVVRQLWEAWERGTPDVGDHTLLENADVQSERLNVMFRDHPAWKTMIQVGASRGTHRLMEPGGSSATE
jgi:hypothetical protein